MNSEAHHSHTTMGYILLRRPVALLWLLILSACALVASTYKTFGATWDEPEHLGAGMQLLDRDFYIYDVQHPPLARMAIALGPYLAGAHAVDIPSPYGGEQAGREQLYKTGHYWQYLILARLGILPFLVVLLWSTWAWARHSFGDATALLATLLLISTPPLLGHAGFAALDVPGAAMCTLACYWLLRWFESHTWKHAIFAGASSGLAVATKLSALPFIGVVGLAWLPCWWFSRARHEQTRASATALRRWLLQAGSIVPLALICAMLTYSVEFRYTVTAQQPINVAWNFLFGADGWMHELWYAIARSVPLPIGVEQLVLSIQALLKHNQSGHLSYLLGQLSENGFAHFYVVALAVKTPLPLLALGLGGLIMLALRARRVGWSIAATSIAFVVLLAFCSIFSRINIGLRHVFVLYPLLSIAAAAMLTELWQCYRQRVARAALVALLGWQLSALYSAYPDYLSYFNVTAGKHPEHILIDSDLDWGQDVVRLQRRLTELQVTKFAFVYRGTVDVIGERLPGVWMAQPLQPTTGWVAASIYARETFWEGKAFKWLKQYTPRERIGTSIDLYYIPETAPP